MGRAEGVREGGKMKGRPRLSLKKPELIVAPTFMRIKGASELPQPVMTVIDT